MIRALAIVCIGCATSPGVDLALVPDPNLNSTDELVTLVDSVVVIVDSDEGLYAPGEERAAGNIQIENVDGDPDLEVVSTVVMPGDHLPIIRLLQGTMPDVLLDLRFLGLPPAGGPPVALGRAQGVMLDDPIMRLDVPFNLRPDLLPPRITQVLPGDGETLEECLVPAVYLMFSRPIDAATVAGAVRVEGAPPDDVMIDASGLTATLFVSNVSGSGPTLRYMIEVDPTIRGIDGRVLDQVPSQPGDQGFSATYEPTCGPGRKSPMVACGDTGPIEPTCPFSGLECIDGECVPSSCDDAECTTDSVCDPATSRCTLDCRIWGDDQCPDSRPTCDEASGVCID